MDSDERIEICVRVKPPQDFNVLWEASGNHAVRSVEGNERFLADEVFVPTATNLEVFEKVGKNLVDSTLSGYNTAICAYGQSGSGKTHTLLGTSEEDGLVSHVFRYLFDSMANKQENDQRTFLVELQVIELYCEKIRDLLRTSVAEPMISEENNLPQVKNVFEASITSPEQAIQLVQQAQTNRAVGETVLNEQSSRSHAIIRISVESSITVAGQANLKNRHSVMTIVDLAGSENAALATGVRMREGNLINQSLFHLTKVINLLTDKNPPKYIPFRDSKLTRILKPALGGNSKTMMICCIDPENQDHTARTLKFSQRVKMVKSCAMVNEAEEKGKLGEVLEEMERLKEEMKAMKEEQAAREKQDRIKALNAQLIGGHRDIRTEIQPVRTNRRMTWAPGALAKSLGRRGSLSPVAKKSRPLDILEELDDTRRTSDPSVTSVSTLRVSGPEDEFITNKISLSRSDGAVDNEEIDKLRQDGLQLEMRVRQLESEKEEIQSEKAQQTLALEEKQRELERQLRVSQETNENLKFFESRLVNSECALEDTKRLFEQEKEAREQAERELKEYKTSSIKKLAQLETQVTDLSANKKSLEDRINHGEMSVAQRERMVAHGEKLAEEVGSLKTQLKNLQDLYDEEVERRSAEEKRRERLSHELKDVETVAGNDKKELQQKLDVARCKLAAVEEESARKEKDFQDEITALRGDLALNADDVVAKKDAEILALKKINDNLNSELATTKTEAEQTRSRAIAEVAGEVKNKMEETEEIVKQLQLENSKLKQTNAVLMEHAEEGSKASQSSEELRGTVTFLRSQIEQNEETITHYKERAARVDVLEKKVASYKQQIQNLTHDLETKKTTVDHLVNRVNQHRRDLTEQSNELVNIDKEAKELKEELRKAMALVEEKNKSLAEHEAKVAQTKADFEKEKAAMNSATLKAKEAMETITRRNMVMESDLDRLNKELAEAKRREEDGFQERSEAYSIQIDKLEDEKRALDRSLAAAEVKTKDLEKQLSTKQIITERCLKESVDLRAALELSNSGEKDRQLADLKRKLDEIKRKLADAEDANMAQEQERRKIMACSGGNEKVTELVRQLEATRKKLAEAEKATIGGDELAELRRKLEAAEKQNKEYADEKEVGMAKYMKVKKENRALQEKLNHATAVRSPLKEKKAV